MAKLNLYISREELAARLGLKRQTLDAWACRGRGPRFTTRRHRVRYSVLEVAAWLDGPAEYEAAAYPEAGANETSVTAVRAAADQ